MNLLAKSPIRGKFYVAMGLLSFIILLLAVSSLQGVYAYRNTAIIMSHPSVELPWAQRIANAASDLRHAFDQSAFDYRTDDDHVLHRRNIILNDGLTEFYSECVQLRASMDAYRELITPSGKTATAPNDHIRELEKLKEIEEHLRKIEAMDLPEGRVLGFVRSASMKLELNELTDAAQELPKFCQQRLAGFQRDARSRYRTWLVITWSSIFGAFVIFIAMWWVFRRMVMHPFRQLMVGCRRMGTTDFSHRIHLGTSDELDELAGALNQMANRFQDAYEKLQRINADLDQQVRERTNEVVRSERLASVGFLAAGVSHEINNPMAAIAWSAEALESRLHDVLQGNERKPLDDEQVEALRENLRRIQQEAFRCKDITDRLLDFSRLGDVQPKPTELRKLVSDVAAMVSNLGQFRNKSIRLLDCTNTIAAVNPQEIKQVVLNLLTNALQSLDEEGAVRVRVWSDPNTARIRIEDDGCGMTEEVRQHLFEPFFTRRRDGRGTGLGLSISYRIVQQHGGKLEAHSDGPGRGTRMDVYLPLDGQQGMTNEQRQAA